jgi:hypothetical protein
MRHERTVALIGSMLLCVACSSGNGKSPATSGGSSGRGGVTGSGGGVAGSGGSTGSGGASFATGGRGGGAGTNSGGSSATGGGGAGSGGTSSATGGRGGGAGMSSGGSSATGGGKAGAGGSTAGSSGSTGSGGGSAGSAGRGSGGASASGGAATGGSAGGAGGQIGSGGGTSAGTGGGSGGVGTGGAGAGGTTAVAGDDFVSNVKVAVHPNTNTILVVTWTQLKAADKTLLEFSFSGSSVMTSRAQAGATGSHRDVVLGVPEKTAVTVRIVNKLGSVDYKTKDYQGTTGAVPSGFPQSQVLAYDATLASPERWMLGAVEASPVEKSTDDCSDLWSCYYMGPFWIYIMDRQGRIVWYWADPSDNASSAYPRVARDGEYIVIDKGRVGKTGVVKMTLDRQYYEFVSIADLDDAMDVTTDGSVLYDTQGELRELKKDGTTRTIWNGSNIENYSNTVNWNPADDTVLLSFPDAGVVVQINRQTGAVVGQYGNASGSYAFSPSPWKFQFPHSPTITPQGTLIVSTHLPDYPDGTAPGPNHHAFEEFTIDRTNKKLTQKWVYSDGPEWANAKGFVMRLANGNTLANYGTGGVIREITPDKKTVFHVKFPGGASNVYNNKMVGNNVYVDDLYALNGGGPQ